MKLLTACVTPFSLDYQIDYTSLSYLLHKQAEVQNGVILLGSTGESLALTLKEKEAVVAHACSLGLSIPLIVGVSGVSLSESLEWVRICRSYPIQGFLITSPIYSKPGVKGQIRWFEMLLDEAEKPSILYNIPSRAGSPLHVDTVRYLVSHPSCFGVKDSGGSVTRCREYAEISSDLVVYCGDDGLWKDMHTNGAQGLISVLSNAWPKEAQDYVHNPSCESCHAIWQELASWMGQSTNPIAIKALLAFKKDIRHDILRLPLSREDLQNEEGIVNLVQRMSFWSNETNHFCTVF